MNDLRSLEGIGQVLSQKLNRTKLTKSRNRNHSDPLSIFIPNNNNDNCIISTPTTKHGDNNNNTNNNSHNYDISTPICEYFPIEIAQLLSTNIQNGYNQSLYKQSQPPKLVKSISDCGNFNDLTWFSCSPHEHDINNIKTNIAYNNDHGHYNYNSSHSQKPSLTFPSLTTIPSTTYNPVEYEDIDEEEEEIYELQLPEMGEGEIAGFPAFDSPPPISFVSPPSLAPIKIDNIPQSLSQTEAPTTPYQGLLCLDLNEDECNHTSISKDDDSHSNHINNKHAGFQPLITSKNEIMIEYHMDDDQKELESAVVSDIETPEHDETEYDIEFINFKDDYMEYITKNKVNNIGTGASGIVTKAFHYNSCKMVAIKQCRSKQKHESLSFIKEAKLYQQFKDNENIINVLDFGRDISNGELKMTLEYMDLGSSDHLNINRNINSWRYRENIVGHIILNLLNGLKDLHKTGYIHNDIKPANILCNKYGEIKLSDFGLVGKLDPKIGVNHLTKNCGTQRYQAPEKLIKSPSRYTTKSDIWSVGVTAFELLFDTINGDSELWYIYGNAQNILNKKVDGHSHFLSNECCDFINKCLISDDKSRPNIEKLLQHSWLKYIKTIDMNNKWPWIKLIHNKQINNDELYSMDTMNIISPSNIHTNMNMDNNDNDSKMEINNSGKQGLKRSLVSFESVSERFSDIIISPQAHNDDNKQYNEDLLFMISALIIHYCKKNIDLTPNGSLLNNKSMHRIPNESGYCDDERISNIAHYALCSEEMVINRIQRTVYYIKSQLNNPEISRIDS